MFVQCSIFVIAKGDFRFKYSKVFIISIWRGWNASKFYFFLILRGLKKIQCVQVIHDVKTRFGYASDFIF